MSEKPMGIIIIDNKNACLPAVSPFAHSEFSHLILQMEMRSPIDAVMMNSAKNNRRVGNLFSPNLTILIKVDALKIPR